MSIRFICTCGKHLKARDEMAARRSVCPRCGRPVGVPSLQSSQRGAPAGPLSPQERAQRGRSSPETEPTVSVPFADNPLQDTPAGPYTPLGYRAVELPGAAESE